LRKKHAQNGFFLMFGRSPNVRKRLCKHTLAHAWLTVYSYFMIYLCVEPVTIQARLKRKVFFAAMPGFVFFAKDPGRSLYSRPGAGAAAACCHTPFKEETYASYQKGISI
jgi:hypothetical protein